MFNNHEFCLKYLLGGFLLPVIAICLTNHGCISKEALLKESNQHNDYGYVYLSTGNWAGAYEEFNMAREVYPKNDRAYFGLGLALYFQGKFDLAIQNYQQAIEINANVPEYYNNMAAALAETGRWKEVIEYCMIALDNPSYSTPGFAFYNIGCAYLNSGNLKSAVEYLNRSKMADPTYMDTFLQLGKALFNLGDFKNAILNLDEAKRLYSKLNKEDAVLETEIDYFLGRSYLEEGDISSAQGLLRTVIEKAPGSNIAKESSKLLKKTQTK